MICHHCHKPSSEIARLCAHCGADLKPDTQRAQHMSVQCEACACAMDVVDWENVDVDICPRCAGIWFDRGELELLKPSHAVAGRTALSKMARQLSHLASAPPPRSHIPCPVCYQRMLKRAHPTTGQLMVAVCQAHGAWFERNDARRLLDLMLAGKPVDWAAAQPQGAQRRSVAGRAQGGSSSGSPEWGRATDGLLDTIDLFDLFD